MKRIGLAYSLLGVLFLLLAGCQSVPKKPTMDELVLQYPDYEIQEEGVLYKDIKEGTGSDKVQYGSIVTVHYVGELENGKQFDSSRDKGRPFDFQVNVSGVIEGWHEGLLGMKKGGIRKLVIAPYMGYGAEPKPNIPANSTLLFEIEVLDIEEE